MKIDLDRRNAYSGSRYREARMNENLSDTDIEFRIMDERDWAKYVNRIPGGIYYSIRLKDSKEMVGYVGICPKKDSIEVYIFEEHRKKSYAYASVKAFSELYVNGVITGKKEAKVEADIHMDNDAAVGLAEKIGFERQCVVKTTSSFYHYVLKY